MEFEWTRGKHLAAKNYYGVPVTDPNSIAFVNPLRYRGYVYDDETGLYYLQSRYYDPTTCRFINADVYCDTQSGSPLSTNMFAYCENCPLLRYDKNGKDAWWIQAEKAVWPLVGHTSILIEQKTDYWWYLYWGPSSIQLLFIGTPTGKYLNMALKRITEVYNKYFPYLDLPEPNRYTGALIYKGNFYNSFIEARYLFRSREYYSKTKVYTLKFNPFISEKEYNTLINSNQVVFWKLLKGASNFSFIFTGKRSNFTTLLIFSYRHIMIKL